MKREPRLWLRHLELKGCLRQMNKIWQVILKLQRGATLNILSLKITYIDPAIGSLDRDVDYASDEPDCCIEENNISSCWEKGFLKNFPFVTLEHLDYSGRDSYIDSYTWQALNDCANLRSLKFRSRRRDHSNHWNESFEPLTGPILRCPLKYLEIDVEVRVDFRDFNYSDLKSLAIKTMLYVEDVKACIKKAAKTLVELVISSTELDKIPFAHIMEVHDDQCEDEEDHFACHCWTRECQEHQQRLEARNSLLMPELTSFKAIANSQVGSIEKEEERGDYGTTRYEYHISAPQLTEMIYIGYLGWDKTLFESCYANLKVVHFDIYPANAIAIYGAISRLTACEKLTLRTRSCLKKMEEPLPIDPFNVDPDNEQVFPCHSLVKLVDLTLINDEVISSKGLLDFITYSKVNSDCSEVMNLSIQQCSKLASSDIEELEKMVAKLEYIAFVEVPEDEDEDAKSCYSYSSVQVPFL